MYKISICLLTCVLILAVAGSATAVTVWTGVIDSDFYNENNWTAGVPIIGGSLSGNIGGYTGSDPVISGTGATATTLYIGISDGDGKLTIAPGADVLLTPNRDLNVGSTRGGSSAGHGELVVGTGAVVTVSNPATETNWDLAFMRNHIRTNSGTSGGGKGGVYDAGVVGLESVTEALETGYVVDVNNVEHTIMDFTQEPPVVIIDINASAVLETWGAFDTSTSPPPFNVSNKIFVVKTADGKFAKIHVKAYSNSEGTGHITFEYKYQTDGTVSLE